MKIGVVGSGKIGGTIGKHWARAGHEVFFSSRNPRSLSALLEEAGPNAQAGPAPEAVGFADVLLLAMPYMQSDAALAALEPENRKVLIDARNPYDQQGRVVVSLTGDSATLALSQRYLLAKVAKAFNTIFRKVFEEKHLLPLAEKIAVPIACDDEEASGMVATLIENAGFIPMYVGQLRSAAAREMEPGKTLYGKALTLPVFKRLLSSLVEIARTE